MTKKRSKNLEKPSKQTYEDFLRSVRLFAVGLRDCRSNLDRGDYYRIAQGRDGLTRINAEYKLTQRGKGHFDASGTCSVTIEDQKKKKEVLSIACSLEAHYHAEFEHESDYPERFVNREMRLILWPYFREFISNLTARMAIRPVVLPLATDQ